VKEVGFSGFWERVIVCQ